MCSTLLITNNKGKIHQCALAGIEVADRTFFNKVKQPSSKYLFPMNDAKGTITRLTADKDPTSSK